MLALFCAIKEIHRAGHLTSHESLRPRLTSQRVIWPAAWITSSVQKPSSTWKMGLEYRSTASQPYRAADSTTPPRPKNQSFQLVLAGRLGKMVDEEALALAALAEALAMLLLALLAPRLMRPKKLEIPKPPPVLPLIALLTTLLAPLSPPVTWATVRATQSELLESMEKRLRDQISRLGMITHWDRRRVAATVQRRRWELARSSGAARRTAILMDEYAL